MIVLAALLLQYSTELTLPGRHAVEAVMSRSASAAQLATLQRQSDVNRRALADALMIEQPDLPEVRRLAAEQRRLDNAMDAASRAQLATLLDRLSPADQIAWLRRLYAPVVPPPIVTPSLR